MFKKRRLFNQQLFRFVYLSVFFLFFLISPHILLAEGFIRYEITVLDRSSQPMVNLPVVAHEKNTERKVRLYTNDKGEVVFMLSGVNDWIFDIGEMISYKTINIVPRSYVEIKDLVIYNPVKESGNGNMQSADLGNFSVITSNIKNDDPFLPGSVFLAITIVHPRGYPLAGIQLQIVDPKHSVLYQAMSDSLGQAYFILPADNGYEIMVDRIRNYAFLEFGDEYLRKNYRIQYAPSDVIENIENDTIVQVLPDRLDPSFSRALIAVEVKGGPKDGMNEPVFVTNLATGQVYKAQTNRQRTAYFLLPIKQLYMIDLEMEEHVDAIDLRNAGEMTRGKISVNYNPDPRRLNPEAFIPTPDMLFLPRFNDFLTKQYMVTIQQSMSFS